MSVYVDPLINYGWRLGPSCHLWADSVEELHAFAGRLGMHRSWFQDKDLPHYDLTEGRRLLAVMLGAVQLGRRESVNKWRALQAARDGGCRELSRS